MRGEWTGSRWFGALPAPAVEHGTRRYSYELEVEPTERRMLVALELPVEAPAGAQAGHDQVLGTRRPLVSVTRWRMTSAAPVAFETALRPMLRSAALRLPEGFNPRTQALAAA